MLILDENNGDITVQFDHNGKDYQIICSKANLDEFIYIRKKEIDIHYENGGEYSDLLWKDYTKNK